MVGNPLQTICEKEQKVGYKEKLNVMMSNRLCLFRKRSSGLSDRVIWYVYTVISEEHSASIFRVEGSSETLVTISEITWWHNPDQNIFHAVKISYRCLFFSFSSLCFFLLRLTDFISLLSLFSSLNLFISLFISNCTPLTPFFVPTLNSFPPFHVPFSIHINFSLLLPLSRHTSM